jgi:hypothetical protein
MIFRELDINGDWTFGRGKQNYLVENRAIMKNIETTLKWFFSECFFAPDGGVPWFSLLGQKNTELLLLSLKNTIINCDGVTKITDILFELSQDRVATVSYDINTVYSQSVSGSVTL